MRHRFACVTWASILAAMFIFCAFEVAPAQAKLTKYWVLKVVAGANPIYTAFKSKEACEAEKRRILKGMKQFEKKFRGSGVIMSKTTAKCLDHIPYGYERPRF